MAINNKLTIEGARLVFKNLSGKGSEYNKEGDRNFAVVLDDEQAERLASDGWAVKVREPREGYEDEGNFNTLRVNVKFGPNEARNPKIYRISNGRMVQLTENSVGCIDFDDIENVDLVIRPYNWMKANRSGTSAYLEEMYVTVKFSPLQEKYARYSGDQVHDDFTEPDGEMPY